MSRGRKNTLKTSPRSANKLTNLGLDDPNHWTDDKVRKMTLRKLQDSPEVFRLWRAEIEEKLGQEILLQPLGLTDDEVRNIPWAKYADDLYASHNLAPLRGLNFSGSDMRAVVDLIIPYWEATGQRNQKYLPFIDCDLSNTNWRNSTFHGIEFTRCDLSGADFKDSGWYRFVLQEVVINETSFENNFFTYTEGLNFTEGIRPNFRNVILDGCAIIVNKQLSEADFSLAAAKGCRFHGGQIVSSSFKEAKLAYTNFGNTTVTGCDFSNSQGIDPEVAYDLNTAINHGNKF